MPKEEIRQAVNLPRVSAAEFESEDEHVLEFVEDNSARRVSTNVILNRIL